MQPFRHVVSGALSAVMAAFSHVIGSRVIWRRRHCPPIVHVAHVPIATRRVRFAQTTKVQLVKGLLESSFAKRLGPRNLRLLYDCWYVEAANIKPIQIFEDAKDKFGKAIIALTLQPPPRRQRTIRASSRRLGRVAFGYIGCTLGVAYDKLL